MEGNLRDIQLSKLSERAKELRCIYQVCEALKDEDAELISVFKSVIDAIPTGYQHPTICEVRIILEGKEYASVDFKATQWMQSAEIIIDNHISGEIQVCYIQEIFENGMVFLPEEQKLLNAIAQNLSRFIFHRRLKKTLEMANAGETGNETNADSSLLTYESDEHWKWRYHAAEKIAGLADFDKFGIEAMYLAGSTKNANAGPGSDIDLIIHFTGDVSQEKELKSWMEGWGLGLAELNFVKTGYMISKSLIDCHIITDEDIRTGNSYAAMIGSVSNSAKLLRSKGQK